MMRHCFGMVGSFDDYRWGPATSVWFLGEPVEMNHKFVKFECSTDLQKGQISATQLDRYNTKYFQIVGSV